jgi:protein SCO1/2
LKRTALSLLLLALFATTAGAAGAQSRGLPRQPGGPPMESSAVVPEALRKIGYDQNLGARLPLDAVFRDETGRPVRLGAYFERGSGRRPVILVLAYYDCPILCGVVLSDLAASLKVLRLDAGKDFDVVVASIDPKETPAQARKAKADAVSRYGRPGTEGGWHFLTAGQGAIDRLAKSIGFRYTYDPASGEFAHAAGIVIATADGRVSRYLLGLEYPPRDVKLGLIESADGTIGTLVDQVVLYCFHYDPAIGRYSAMTLNILRLAAVVTVLGLALLVVVLRRRETPDPNLQGAA